MRRGQSTAGWVTADADAVATAKLAHDAAVIASQEAKAALRASVTAEGKSFYARLTAEIEAAAEAFSADPRVGIALRVYRSEFDRFSATTIDGASWFHLGPSGIDVPPEDPQPAIRVATRTHAREDVLFHYFVLDADGALMLRIHGTDADAATAARLLFSPWLRAFQQETSR